MSNPPADNSGPAGHDGPLPNGGRIIPSPVAQTIMAVAFLIFVTLISFVSVTFIGKMIGADQQVTYWLIELIFALLCAGAGALVGGSADVRSTLNLPGNPTQATLGGAIAMVIVGFLVAYLGRPKGTEQQEYTIEIQNLSPTVDVDNVRYNMLVGAVDDDMSITRHSNLVTIAIPSTIRVYHANVVVFKNDRDSPKVIARCSLTFDSAHTPEIVTMEIVPDSMFRLYLSADYVAKVVHESIRMNRAIGSEPCIEGVMKTEAGNRKLLNGYFTLVPLGTGSWLRNATHISGTPPYAMMASAVSEDLPPSPLPGGGVTSQEPASPTAQSSPPPSSQPPASAQSSAPAVPPAPPNPAPASTATSSNNSSPGSNSGPPAPVPPAPTPLPPATNTPPSTNTFEAQVDAYILGQNLDRTQLYQNWHQTADYVVQGFRTAVNNGSPSAARYVNLIANALNVIDDGKYLAPTLRPNWNQSTKPDRLGQNNPIPGFVADDYGKVVGLLCSTDANSRTAAQRLLKSFPADDFYQHIQNLQKQSGCDLIFISESAVDYFYNRIVEYDGTFVLDTTSINWLNGNYNNGNGWVTLATAKDSSQDVFGALLDYGYGVTLWDRGTTSPANQATGLSHFKRMLQILGSSKGVYPSNPAHIAAALRELNNPGVTSKTLSSATPYNKNSLYPVTGNYITSVAGVALYALPDGTSKQVGSINGGSSVRIYLRAQNWDMVQAGAQFGWAQRTAKSAGN